MIDWDVAVSTGVRFARPGPQVSLAEARQTVAELRELYIAVERPVREVTKLQSKVGPGKVAVRRRTRLAGRRRQESAADVEPFPKKIRQSPPAVSDVALVMGVGSRIS